MPSHLLPLTRLPGRRLALAVVGVLAAVGCESLRVAPNQSPQADPAVRQASTNNPPRRPGKHWLRASQYVFYSDVPLEANDPLFKELEGLPEQVQKDLHLPPGEQVIQVYLFDNQERYEAYMRERFPWLPVRRAYFIADQKKPGAADELQVYTWMGEHIRTDLRHELTHATLHAVLKGVPLWLDEGLAGVYEQPAAMDGVNPGHLKDIAAGPFLPDLARLEKFAQVRQMEKREYQEAWAWAHFMLHDPRAKPVLVEYVAKLREDPNPGPIQAKLTTAVGDPMAALAEHLAGTRVPPAAAR